jgi:dephospho-CoA kinase
VSRIKIIGLTGGIGCGKSTVSNYLVTKYKLKIIDCDLISREIYEIDSPAYK